MKKLISFVSAMMLTVGLFNVNVVVVKLFCNTFG